MNKVPMVSIIMPAYNAERYLEEAVTSVINQTFPDWELLILDDRSVDHTFQIMDRLQGQDTRIRTIRNDCNMGAAATRNYGMTMTRGEWIAFLDSDDRWEPTKLEKQIALVQSDPNIEFTFTGSAFVEDDGISIAYELHVPEKISRRQLLGQNIISCSSVMIRKDLILKHPMPDNRDLHEDFATWLSILEETPYAYGVDEPLLIYRRALASKSGNKSKSAAMNWNTYEEANVTGLRRIISMISYTFHGLNKYAHLRFNSYNLMLRKERLKKLFLFTMSFFLVTAWTAVFAKIWFDYYNHKEIIRGVFVYWGHVALFSMYFAANALVGKAFHSFKVMYRTMPELIFSHALTAVVVNLFTLIQIALIGRWSFAKLIRYAPPMGAVLLINLVIAIFWSRFVRWLYTHVYPPHDLLVIQGEKSTDYLEQMLRAEEDHYHINGKVYLQDGRENIEREIMKHESVMLGSMPSEERNYYIKFCYEHKKRCYCQTSITDILFMQADRLFLSDIPLYLYKNCGMSLEQRIVKRFIDLFLSLLVVLLLSPLYLILAVIVKAVSHTSVLEKQNCLTKNGKIYRRIKFRTHYKDGCEIDSLSWIRESHLDELPQFFTILKGDMSIVGPYPETERVASLNREMIPEAWYRQEVKAGLTGYAQVYGKYTTNQMNKLKMDIYYIQNYSIWLDLRIILMTGKVLFFRQSKHTR